MSPSVGPLGTHGGYCGPAVKPIAMSMVSEIARAPATHGMPISGIGGIEKWSDAAEYIALGCGTVQVCTAAMVYGFKIVEEMKAGLEQWMDEKGYATIDDFRAWRFPMSRTGSISTSIMCEGADRSGSLHQMRPLPHCVRGHLASGHHQLVNGVRQFEVKEEECVGCNLCAVVCPVENCITMVEKPEG